MKIEVTPMALPALEEWRERYRQEMNCQIVHDSWHRRGFTDLYGLRVGGRLVGYGAVGGSPGEPKDIVKEFYLERDAKGGAGGLFEALIEVTRAQSIEAQTNDRLLSLMLFDRAIDLEAKAVLFADAFTSAISSPGASVRRLTPAEQDRAFPHTVEPVGDWGVEVEGTIVATGGFFVHYNPPFADLYMEVAPDARRRGFGSYLVQELKRHCLESGRTPAARCDATNVASRRTLQRAGLLPCGRIIRGRVSG